MLRTSMPASQMSQRVGSPDDNNATDCLSKEVRPIRL